MYLFGSIMVLVVVAFTAVWTGSAAGISPAYILDLPSLLLMLLIVVPILIAAGIWKDINSAFRMILTRKWDVTLNELKRAEHGLGVLMNALMTAGIFLSACSVLVSLGTVVGADGMEMESLCANLEVSLLPIFYGLIFRLILLPLKTIVQRHVIDYMEQDI